MPFSKLNLPLKIQGGTLCLMTRYVSLSQYFECKQTYIEWILNKVSRGGGGREGFHIRFLCRRSKQYVEFGIERVIKYIDEPHIL